MGSARTLLAVLASTVIATGCGASAETPDAGPEISFTRGGGLAGDSYALAIDPAGAASLTIRQGIEERTIDFEVSEAGLEELEEHLEAADVEGLGESRSDTCADCYGYSIEFGDEEASADSSTITEEFFAAADPLERLLRDHLPRDARY